MKKHWWPVVATVMASALAWTACGGDDEGDDADASGDDATEQAATTTDPGIGATIAVTDVWARSSPAMADAGAAYMAIENAGGADDALVAASVDPSVAGAAELHEVVMVDDGGGDMSSTTMGGDMSGTTMGGSMEGEGTMRMQQVEQIDLAAGESVELEPGGYHIMLLDLVAPLEEGTTIQITLDFENATSVTVNAEVRTE